MHLRKQLHVREEKLEQSSPGLELVKDSRSKNLESISKKACFWMLLLILLANNAENDGNIRNHMKNIVDVMWRSHT